MRFMHTFMRVQQLLQAMNAQNEFFEQFFDTLQRKTKLN